MPDAEEKLPLGNIPQMLPAKTLEGRLRMVATAGILAESSPHPVTEPAGSG